VHRVGLLRDHQERHPARRSRSRATCPSTSSTRSRRGARSTTWSASTSRRCCGRKCAGPVRRPRAEPGAAHDLRARGRDPGLRAAGILDDRRAGRAQRSSFPAKLIEYAGKKVEQFSFTNEGHARARSSARCAPPRRAGQGGRRRAHRSTRRSTASSAKRNPAPPFTTSTLQQEAARKLGFSAQRTMRLAQQLYEGVDFGEGAVGLITYMRTDSVNARQRGGRRDPPGHREAVRQGRRCRGAARLQDQVEECAGSARGRAPHVGRDHAADSKARSTPTSSSSTR
jgi:hypothetical protein